MPFLKRERLGDALITPALDTEAVLL